MEVVRIASMLEGLSIVGNVSMKTLLEGLSIKVIGNVSMETTCKILDLFVGGVSIQTTCEDLSIEVV